MSIHEFVGKIQFLAEVSLVSCHRDLSIAHTTKTESKQEGKKECQQVSTYLIMEVAACNFAIFYSLEVSYKVQPTLKRKGVHEG